MFSGLDRLLSEVIDELTSHQEMLIHTKHLDFSFTYFQNGFSVMQLYFPNLL